MRRHEFPGDRPTVRAWSVVGALHLLRRGGRDVSGSGAGRRPEQIAPSPRGGSSWPATCRREVAAAVGRWQAAELALHDELRVAPPFT